MGILTFDWGQIVAFNVSPLVTPWWAMANFGVTIVLFYWLFLAILHVRLPFFPVFLELVISVYRVLQYSNLWYSAYLPILSSYSFDNTASIYNVSRIINSDFSFNLQAYKEYSPPFLPTSYIINYWLQFASFAAAFTHTFLYHRQQFWTQARRSPSGQPDIYARLMSAYKEVPDWWYLIIFRLFRLFLMQNAR